MQQQRYGRVVVQGLAYIQERMLEAAEQIAVLVPPVQQKQAMRDMLRCELGHLSHIWHQSTLGDYLYQTGDQRGGPTTARTYEESAAQLGAKLAAITDGTTPEQFMARFAYPDTITPEEALRRSVRAPVALPAAQAQATLDAVSAPARETVRR